MNKIKCLSSLFCLILINTFLNASKLEPGFKKEECIEMLKIGAYQHDTPWTNIKVKFPEKYILSYRSTEFGLKNRWDLWLSNDSIAVISIRGTAPYFESWLENFYAAMVPAKGEIKISENKSIKYYLSNDEKSAVHVGWLIGFAHLKSDIDRKIDSCINLGIKNFIITGHSQGGAIASLLTAALILEKNNGKFNDIFFKTYCSASPKPGNINFAREYAFLTKNLWAFNLINSADWVPETPFSVQTVNDLNEVNPFILRKKILKNQNFFTKAHLNFAYTSIDKSLNKPPKKFKKYLGKKAGKIVHKKLPYLEKTKFSSSNYFVNAGQIIILHPDDEYFKLFSSDTEKIFIHHSIYAYLYLLEKQLE